MGVFIGMWEVFVLIFRARIYLYIGIRMYIRIYIDIYIVLKINYVKKVMFNKDMVNKINYI